MGYMAISGPVLFFGRSSPFLAICGHFFGHFWPYSATSVIVWPLLVILLSADLGRLSQPCTLTFKFWVFFFL